MAFASPTARSCAAAHKRAARLPPRSSARRAAARTGQAAESARGLGVRARASSESKEAEATAGGLRGAVRYLLEAAWEIFSVPDDKGVKFTLQPYSGTPLSKDDRRRIDRMAGAVRSAAAYGLVASTSDSEADLPTPSGSGEAGEITQDFGKHGEQTVANTSPIGVVASAVRAVAGRFKDDEVPDELFEGNLQVPLHYPEMTEAEAKKLERFATLVAEELVHDDDEAKE